MQLLAVALVTLAVQDRSAEAPAAEAVLARLADEAERVAALVENAGTRAFLAAARALPAAGERTVLYDAEARAALTPAQHAALPAEAAARFLPTPFAPEFFYTTRYGSPLAYARALDLALAHVVAGGGGLAGKRILDFGYGGIGHLRMLASLGCDVVGVDVDTLLACYYGASDQGTIPSAVGGPAGRLTLVHGRWPIEEAARSAVGVGFDLVVAKNVLKKGYVRPEKEVDPRMLVDLGLPPERFLAEVARVLAPGGVLAIYNLCPAPREDRYLPWAYGESPFTRAEFEAAGLEVLAFDVDDRAQAIELGYALRWDEQGQDVENDLFAWYTLARRRS